MTKPCEKIPTGPASTDDSGSQSSSSDVSVQSHYGYSVVQLSKLFAAAAQALDKEDALSPWIIRRSWFTWHVGRGQSSWDGWEWYPEWRFFQKKNATAKLVELAMKGENVRL